MTDGKNPTTAPNGSAWGLLVGGFIAVAIVVSFLSIVLTSMHW